MDKLQNPAGSTPAKSDGKAASKPTGKAAAKSGGQAEVVPAAGAPVPADLIIAARLSLSEVSGAICTRHLWRLKRNGHLPCTLQRTEKLQNSSF